MIEGVPSSASSPSDLSCARSDEGEVEDGLKVWRVRGVCEEKGKERKELDLRVFHIVDMNISEANNAMGIVICQYSTFVPLWIAN